MQWRHIYSCYRRHLIKAHGFAELCFLCRLWVVSGEEWESHCQSHLDELEAIPTRCDPLVYGGVPISLGYCPFHLGNEGLPALVRMRQFPRAEWKIHIHEELRELDTKLGGHECPLKTTPRCPESAVGLQDLKFHLQDIHGVDAFYGPKRTRRTDDIKTETGSKRRRNKVAHGTQLIKADDLSISPYFGNPTPESLGACKPESNEMGTNSATVEAEAHPTPPYFITLPTKSPEERKPEGPKSLSASSFLAAGGQAQALRLPWPRGHRRPTMYLSSS